MKKTLIILTICCGFLLQDQFAFAVSAFSEAKKEMGYISLNSKKTVEVNPTAAKITFTVENTAPDSKKASYENNVTATSVISALKLVNPDYQDIMETTNFVVRPVYTNTKDGNKVIKNYIASNSITVETKNVSSVPTLIEAAISNGANRADNLYYTYDNEKAVCSKIYPQLIKELKVQANTIAQSIDSRLNGIKIINATCTSEGSIISGRKLATSFANTGDITQKHTPASIETEKVKIKAFVSADFYVK